jgi:GrpB-like predicted nucleotidyltransferase (UPF0157 family)
MAGPDIEIVPYRTQWRSQYAMLAALLRDALGDAVIALHHIGSTAVPDLVAKDVIDIQLTVASLADYPYQRIEAVGFELGKPMTDHCPPGLTLPRQELVKRFYKYRHSATNLHVRERGRFKLAPHPKWSLRRASRRFLSSTGRRSALTGRVAPSA